MLEPLLNLLFPPHCPVCRAYVPTRGAWCESCLARTTKPHPLSLPPELHALTLHALAAGYYHSALRDLIRALKYHSRREYLPALDTLLHTANFSLTADCAVPVPLHPTRLRERGFNQTEAIFQNFLKARNIPIENLLLRKENTKPLHGLSPAERRKELSHAFTLAKNAAVQGKSLLLLDDIFTTGATLTACAKTLHAAGAREISVLVLADANC